jgi:hypothetical protein
MEAGRTTQCEFEAERVVSCTDMNNDSRLSYPTSKCVGTEFSGYTSEIIENQPYLCNLCPTVERIFNGSGSDVLSDDPGVLVASSMDDECEADNNADARHLAFCSSTNRSSLARSPSTPSVTLFSATLCLQPKLTAISD